MEKKETYHETRPLLRLTTDGDLVLGRLDDAAVVGVLLLELGAEVDIKRVEDAVGHGRDYDVDLLHKRDKGVERVVGEDVVVVGGDVLLQRGPQVIWDGGDVGDGGVDGRPRLLVFWRVQLEQLGRLVFKGLGDKLAADAVKVGRLEWPGVLEPAAGELAKDVEGLAPEDELGETLHEEHEGEVEGVVQAGPYLLAPGWELELAHPVKVDEEDKVDCPGGGGDDANSVGV